MSSVSGSTFRNPGGIYETENMRLQREVDSFTSKLEHEKRRLLILDDQLAQVMSEIEERKDQVKKIKPSAKEEKKTNL